MVSIIPSPRNHQDSKTRFKTANEAMKEFAKQNPSKLSFLNMDTKFLRNDLPVMSLFDLGERSIFHLNDRGADCLTFNMRHHLMCRPRFEFFE